MRRFVAGATLVLILFVNTYLAFAQPPKQTELLVRKYDGPGGRKSGDIISVKELPHNGWGKGEGPPNYVIVRITDVDEKGIEQYIGRHVPVKESEPHGAKVRSKYRFDLSTLPNYQGNSVYVTKIQTTSNLIDRRAEALSVTP